MSFFNDLVKIATTAEYRNYILQGFLNTLAITFIAVIIGLVLGFIVAIVKVFARTNKALAIPNAICNFYTTVFRGTPVALQLFIFVFALFAIPGFKVYAVILCFGINSGAYVSENIRAGIMSVDSGQMEAGTSLGLSEIKTMRKVIIPQAIKNVIPAIGNEIIALLKETASISMIGSTVGTLTFDLNQASSTISYAISDFFAPSIIAALFYLIVVYIFTLLIKLIEKRLHKNDKHS